MRSIFRSAGIGVATIAMLAACGPKQPKTFDIPIKLDWNTDGVPVADGHGTFTTDLGYTVEADRFEVTTYSFELVPCDGPLPAPPNMKRQSSLSFIGTAWAGHRVGHPATLTATSWVEKPLQAQEHDFDTLMNLPNLDYCRGHYLIARLPPEVATPDEQPNVGIALRVHGRYRKGDADWSDFAVETTVAYGTLADFKPEGSRKGIRFKTGDSIVVTRQLGRAFNGVDFAAMPQPEVARQILRELIAGTTLTHVHGVPG